MNNSTIDIRMPYFEEGFILDLGSLYARLETLEDKRKGRGKRYALALVLVLLLLAKLCGQDRIYGIAQWVRERREAFMETFGLRRGQLPSHNTYRRVLRDAVDVEELEKEVSQFLSSGSKAGQSVLISIDGKTLRGSIPKGGTQGVHLLAAYLPREGLVLMQVAVQKKENEIRAAPRLLSRLDLRGKVVVADAMFTQRNLSAQIVEAGGDYIWFVKDNQPGLREAIATLFQPEDRKPGFGMLTHDFEEAHRVRKSHGRIEERTLKTSRLLNDYLDWPYLEQVFKLERRVTNRDGQGELVYGITSLSRKTGADDLLDFTQGYWGIENGLHYRRDKTLQEDATRMTSPILAQAMAIMNNLVIGLVSQEGWPYLPQARRHYAAHLDKALDLLLRQLA